jgi:hypothetical protein
MDIVGITNVLDAVIQMLLFWLISCAYCQLLATAVFD